MTKDLKNYLWLILTILTIFSLTFLFTKPKIESLFLNQQRLDQEKNNLTAITQKVTILEQLDDNVLSENLNRLNFILPSEKTIDSLMFTLDRLSKEASVSMISLSLIPGKVSTDAASLAAEKGNYVDVNMEISGRIIDIRNFFESVDRSKFAIRIGRPDLHLTRSMEQLTSLNLKMQAYYKPVPLVLGEIGQPVSPLSKKDKDFLTGLKTLVLPEKEVSPYLSPRKTNPFTNE